jgi:dynein heavy chain
MWVARAYPSLKPLSSWVSELLERCRFVSEWVASGTPAVYWISGFFFPQVGCGSLFVVYTECR